MKGPDYMNKILSMASCPETYSFDKTCDSEASVTSILSDLEQHTKNYTPSKKYGTIFMAQRSGAKEVRKTLATMSKNLYDKYFQERAYFSLAQ